MPCTCKSKQIACWVIALLAIKRKKPTECKFHSATLIKATIHLVLSDELQRSFELTEKTTFFIRKRYFATLPSSSWFYLTNPLLKLHPHSLDHTLAVHAIFLARILYSCSGGKPNFSGRAKALRDHIDCTQISITFTS